MLSCVRASASRSHRWALPEMPRLSVGAADPEGLATPAASGSWEMAGWARLRRRRVLAPPFWTAGNSHRRVRRCRWLDAVVGTIGSPQSKRQWRPGSDILRRPVSSPMWLLAPLPGVDVSERGVDRRRGRAGRQPVASPLGLDAMRPGAARTGLGVVVAVRARSPLGFVVGLLVRAKQSNGERGPAGGGRRVARLLVL